MLVAALGAGWWAGGWVVVVVVGEVVVVANERCSRALCAACAAQAQCWLSVGGCARVRRYANVRRQSRSEWRPVTEMFEVYGV